MKNLNIFIILAILGWLFTMILSIILVIKYPLIVIVPVIIGILFIIINKLKL